MSGEIEPTTAEREAFGRWFLVDILVWVADNLDPDQVWTVDQLIEFIVEHENTYTAMLHYIKHHETPWNVFGELLDWRMEREQ